MIIIVIKIHIVRSKAETNSKICNLTFLQTEILMKIFGVKEFWNIDVIEQNNSKSYFEDIFKNF